MDDPKTAILSIFKRQERNKKQGKKGFVEYQMSISFMGSGTGLLPPYLPAIDITLETGEITQIEKDLGHCRGLLDKCAKGDMNEGESKKQIRELIKKIGRALYKCDPDFHHVILLLEQLKISHVVIFTNDSSLPWGWTYAKPNGEQLLCERYACGLIFAAKKWAVEDYVSHLDSSPGNNQAAGHDKIALLIGESVENLKGVNEELGTVMKLVSSRSSGRNAQPAVDKVYCLNASGSLYRENESKNENTEHVSWGQVLEAQEKLKIIHFSGHISSAGSLVIGTDDRGDADLKITLAEIDQIHNLKARPIVFLNGCFSGQIKNALDPGAQISTKLLDRHAQACVVTIFPIKDGVGAHMAKEFYERALRPNTDIGSALLEARNSFPKQDPQRLFFQLYGDPRSKFARSGAMSVQDKVRDQALGSGRVSRAVAPNQ